MQPISKKKKKFNNITGLEKVPISPWLVTLLHICGVIPTLRSPIFPETQSRYHQKLRASANVATPSADISASSAYIVASNGECSSASWCFTMFHDVSQCFKSVLWCFTCGSRCFTKFVALSQCFTSVSWCFTMFNNVLQCLVSHATIGIADCWSPQGSWQRRRDRR